VAGVSETCAIAAEAATSWARATRAERGAALRRMADALEARAGDIVPLADRETALGETRLSGELTRTGYQLRLFAEVLDEGSYLEAAVDHAGETAMGPRPDLRRMLVPLGPVAVFGASNFPLAFSVPGGDTASALAAGCPVVVKAHPAHPETSRLCFEIMSGALGDSWPGLLGIVEGAQDGIDLVEHPVIRAVGFTGSLAGGRALADRAAARPEPIPFYGELGSINAVVVTPAAAAERAGEIGTGLAGSALLGAGQFCTKPGLTFVPSGSAGEVLRDAVVEAARGKSFTMLTEKIAHGYREGAAALRALAEPLVASEGDAVTATVLEIGLADLTAHEVFLDEVFGPLTVLVRYDGVADVLPVLSSLPGALTATVHAAAQDPDAAALAAELQGVAGRLVWNGFPTGVAVSWAQHHGGPWPATNNSIHTSVGATAIRRWLRPFAWQNAPQSVLPDELRDGPVTIPRRVDGVLQLPAD
jgi:NADP-dependent aldehyde dehydrogenase